MKLGTKLSILAGAMFVVWLVSVNASYGAGAGAGNPTVYHVGASSGIPCSTTTYTNAFEIKASTNFAVNIDNMKFWSEANATVLCSISSQATGGYNAVIATVRPIGVATKNKFTAKEEVVCTSGMQAVGTAFRLAANQAVYFDELGGKMQIPKGYALIVSVKTEGAAATYNFFAQFRVWE